MSNSDRRPLIGRLVGAAFGFFLAALALYLAARLIAAVWPVLLVVACCAAAVTLLVMVWRRQRQEW